MYSDFWLVPNNVSCTSVTRFLHRYRYNLLRGVSWTGIGEGLEWFGSAWDSDEGKGKVTGGFRSTGISWWFRLLKKRSQTSCAWHFIVWHQVSSFFSSSSSYSFPISSFYFSSRENENGMPILCSSFSLVNRFLGDNFRRLKEKGMCLCVCNSP